MTRERFTAILDVLGGVTPPARRVTPFWAVLRGAWWVILFLLVWTFSGGSTKFIYVDF